MASDALWPSLTGDDPAGGKNASNIPASQAEANRQPTLSPKDAAAPFFKDAETYA